MFLMVAAYKFFIVFFIATELLLMGCGFWLACTFIVIYSLVIPVLQKDSNLSPAYETNAMPICVQQALATGTLLYVVVFEILRKQQYKIITVTMTFLGVLTMTLIQLCEYKKEIY